MNTKILQWVGSAALALLLTACGGGGSGVGSLAGSAATKANSLPQQMQAVVDQSNNFTDAFCPKTAGGTATGTTIDPNACISEALSRGPSNPTDVVASFCPNAAKAVNSGSFDPTAFLQSFSNPQGFVTSGNLTFPVACLEEAATNLNQIKSLVGGSNPITQQLCPNAAQASTFDPATCLAEITSGSSGSLPGLPGLPGTAGGGGSIGGTQFLNNFCPQSASESMGPQMAVDCLNESSRIYIKIVDLFTASNPIYDNLCPQQAVTGRVEDPIGCFKEALSGGLPSLPGSGSLPGLPGTGGGSVPGLGQLLNAICPNTVADGLGPNTPTQCLAEAGRNLSGLQNLLAGLGSANPLTRALCPNAAAASSFSPAACFQEALGQLPSAGGGSLPGLGMALNQLCPNAASGGFDPATTPTACLMELGANFGNLQNPLGSLGGANPVTQQLCPNAAGSGSFDPAACFTEALRKLPGAGGGLPGFGSLPLISQLCPNTASGSVGPTTPINCLQEAGGNLGQLQNVLGGLTGSNPITQQLCPKASASGSVNPQACLTEALGNLPRPGGSSQLPTQLSGLLANLCPSTAAAGLGPTSVVQCLAEAGGKLGQLQSLLGNLPGGLPGGSAALTNNPLTQQLCPNAVASGSFSPQSCLTEALGNLPGAGGVGGGSASNPLTDALCPTTAAASLSPTTPLDCLVEAGGNLGQARNMLGGLSKVSSNPITQTLCPTTAASGSFDPQGCLTEAFGTLSGGTGGLSQLGQLQGLLTGLSGGASNPLTQALCPVAAATTPFDPVACFNESLSSATSTGGSVPVLGTVLTTVGGLLSGLGL